MKLTEDLIKDFGKLLYFIEEKKPLIHHITNNVTVNDCANITLNWGALPVMAPGLEEVEEMVESASALVLNIGTLEQRRLQAMLKAGKRANELRIPIVLDPVGVGATKFRTNAAQRLLENLDIAVLKGNKGEISKLAGEAGELKGVESIGEYSNIQESATKLALLQDCIVVVSGIEDIITDGINNYRLERGHPLMGQVVGTGCMLGSTLGVFAAAAKGIDFNLLQAVKAAVYYYNIIGEKAALKADTPGFYKIEFMDTIYKMNHEN